MSNTIYIIKDASGTFIKAGSIYAWTVNRSDAARFVGRKAAVAALTEIRNRVSDYVASQPEAWREGTPKSVAASICLVPASGGSRVSA